MTAKPDFDQDPYGARASDWPIMGWTIAFGFLVWFALTFW